MNRVVTLPAYVMTVFGIILGRFQFGDVQEKRIGVETVVHTHIKLNCKIFGKVGDEFRIVNSLFIHLEPFAFLCVQCYHFSCAIRVPTLGKIAIFGCAEIFIGKNLFSLDEIVFGIGFQGGGLRIFGIGT